MEPLNRVRYMDPLPEPRVFHAAVCIRGLILVAGGLSTLELNMANYSQPPCHQEVFAMPIPNPQYESTWRSLPSMTHQGSLHATLIAIENRYVY